jgi:hypothetical protein
MFGQYAIVGMAERVRIHITKDSLDLDKIAWPLS